MRENEIEGDLIETIYFGGGTPSVLTISELQFLIDRVYRNFKVIEKPEITVESNPDDLTEEYCLAISKTPVNRLSIGIQSFFDADLALMNRAHNSAQAKLSLATATKYFKNISVDLIYGIPGMSNKKWRQNIQTVLDLKIKHISCYALTVEPKTALKKLIAVGKIDAPKEEEAQTHFEILLETLTQNEYLHYELSNFGKEGYFSQNNSNYWLGKKYLGIGPSAHSFNGVTRSWNVSNNSLYIKAITNDELPNEVEILSQTDRYNEYIMTGLRTIWGVSIDKVTADFGTEFSSYLLKQSQKYLDQGLLVIENQVIKASAKGKFLTDGIASDLFMVNLNV
jgi:oxygen-independent coproporphyrinogen III oxidase